MELQTVLQNIGFSAKEAILYLKGTELGMCPASTLARQCNFTRTTTASALTAMVSKGFASQIIRNNVTYYQMSPIELLIQQQELKSKHYQAKAQQLIDVLPAFTALTKNRSTKPKIVFYEGVAGLQIAYEEILLYGSTQYPTQPFRCFVGVDQMHPEFLDYLTYKFPKLRKNYTIQSEVLLVDHNDPYTENIKTRCSYRIIKEPLFQFDQEIIVHGDRIAILLYGKSETAGIIIHSETLAKGLNNLFLFVRRHTDDECSSS